MALLEATAQKTEGVPPDVMLALMRQESFFDPLAGSGAGATGLTQVIPSTAKEIAGELGETRLHQRRPAAARRQHRVRRALPEQQLSAFDDNLYYALAAYNAGPGAVDRWQASGRRRRRPVPRADRRRRSELCT